MYRMDIEINGDLIGSIMSHDVTKHFPLGREIVFFPDFTQVRSPVLPVIKKVFFFCLFNLKTPI